MSEGVCKTCPAINGMADKRMCVCDCAVAPHGRFRLCFPFG